MARSPLRVEEHHIDDYLLGFQRSQLRWRDWRNLGRREQAGPLAAWPGVRIALWKIV
jgi:hypothetical protein